MNASDVIAHKRDGLELTPEEIGLFVRGVSDGTIPDYQTSAWLMAAYLRGMTARETLSLTLAMRDSGRRIDLSDLPNGPALDKHSTGGVGDKTTLVVVPILAAAGVPVLKMSGRGLGFSGGTIDKLEAIPGFRTGLTVEEACAQVRTCGAAIIAQSPELAPADKALYALRDVTATIDSIPLIAASIMSKKLAAGAGSILLDVKVGRGAFMKTRDRAEALARAMVDIGRQAGTPTRAVLTAMEEPLGRAVGNALEVREAVGLLRGDADPDPRFRALCLALAAHGLVAAGRAPDPAAGAAVVESLLAQGAAARKWVEMVRAQGGPASLEALYDSLPCAAREISVQARGSGTVLRIDAEQIGLLSMRLGAGRAHKEDRIDPAVGVVLFRKVGSTVRAGDTLAVLHLRAQDVPEAQNLYEAAAGAFAIGSSEELPGGYDQPILGFVD